VLDYRYLKIIAMEFAQQHHGQPFSIVVGVGADVALLRLKLTTTGYLIVVFVISGYSELADRNVVVVVPMLSTDKECGPGILPTQHMSYPYPLYVVELTTAVHHIIEDATSVPFQLLVYVMKNVACIVYVSKDVAIQLDAGLVTTQPLARGL
jgi:hypothetical protein